jgi:adenylylsulfate kinase
VLTEHGINVIFDATANRRAYRDDARRQIPLFVEVYVDTPLAVWMARDPKGIYRKGQAGISQHVPGLQAAYEPLHPDVITHGDRESPETAADRIVQMLRSRGLM